MKKLFSLFAMLATVAASAQVTHVESVGANYSDKTVTFRVWWNAGSRDVTHLSKVWVWVDYIKMNSNNTTSGNTWTRAAVSAASPTASISYDGSNRQGFWLQGNASTNYSATLTVQLNITETKFNWCAYASDYPPNVSINNGTYTFRGTPPFILTAANGATTQTVTGNTLLASALTITPTTIKDKTECPGVFCPYQESDLFIDATHICQQRTSGAKNWEAWIKDTRDNEYYRIVLMPDNKWWLAQNVKYAVTGTANACTKDECGRMYTWAQTIGSWGGSSGKGIGKQGICPPGWVLPVNTDVMAMFNAVSPTTFSTYTAPASTVIGYVGNNSNVTQKLQAKNSPCGNGDDYYGFASEKLAQQDRPGIETRFYNTTHATYYGYWSTNHQPGTGNDCNYMAASDRSINSDQFSVRCFRQ
jgi:uncharacterized protein (TIGR02145 family)